MIKEYYIKYQNDSGDWRYTSAIARSFYQALSRLRAATGKEPVIVSREEYLINYDDDLV